MYDADGEPGEPVTRMLPRSLMVPPGVPDFMTRERHLEPGPVTLDRPRVVRARRRSSAWRCPPTAARRFAAAELDAPLGPHAWRGWRFDWDAPAGRARPLLARHRRRRQHAAARAALEPEGLREQRGRADRACVVASRRLAAPVRIFSGIQPTGRKHLGNYIGAIRGYLDGQERGDPGDLLHRGPARHERRLRPGGAARTTCSTRPAMLMAAGLDPDRCILFRQSDVKRALGAVLAARAR